MMLTASREEGLIEDAAHQLLSGALDMVDRRITTVAVPRDRVVWLPSSATPAEAEALVVSSGHSRLVVVGDGLDDVLGFIHAKDLLTVPSSARSRPLPLGRIRQMLVLSGETSLDDALLAMQAGRVQLAVRSEEQKSTRLNSSH